MHLRRGKETGIMLLLLVLSIALQVCKNTVLFVHNIGVKKYNTVKQAYLRNGLESIPHGNKFCLPQHGFTTDYLRQITTFQKNFSEEHAILLPGRVPGYKRCDLQLLPTSMTKREVWNCYVRACGTLTF